MRPKKGTPALRVVKPASFVGLGGGVSWIGWWEMAAQTRFLNVDLEIVGSVELDPLVRHLEQGAYVLRDDRGGARRLLWLELSSETMETDATLRRFIQLIAALPVALRELWNACDDRCFNIGIQAGATPHDAHFDVRAETIVELAAISARLEITVYAPEPENER